MLKKQQKEASVVKIFAGLVVVAALGYGVLYAKDHVNFGKLTSRATQANTDNMAKARELYDQGNLIEARQLLEPIVEGRNATQASQAAVMLARMNEAEGKTADSLPMLEQAYQNLTASPEHARVAVTYARALEKAGKFNEAVKIFQEVRDTAPPELRAPALVGLGRKAERDNDLLGARELYTKAFKEATWDSEEWNEALDALGQINVALIFSPIKTPESKVHAVQRGDSITSIGNNLNTTQGLIMRANNITETTVLNLNQPIKYTPKDFRIVIERSKCRLFLLDKDGIFKRYKVGLGKPGHDTALGMYKIGNKEKDPTWHKPGGGAIPAGDPRNELGTRWMPLVPDQQGLPPDLGIHGTIRPETVGFYSSNGCARLLPAEIEELYDLVVRATPVEIVEVYRGPNAAPEAAPATPAAAPEAAPAAAAAPEAAPSAQAEPAKPGEPGLPVAPSSSAAPGYPQ